MIPGSPYSKAPIVEALFDIQVDAGAVKLDALQKCQKKVKADYPERVPITEITGHLQIGQIGQKTSLSTASSSESAGFAFKSADKSRLFQTRLDRFTFNHFAPYPGWESFFGQAWSLWQEFRSVVRPRGYKRIALRYINRFDIPLDTFALETYFRTYPEVSRDLPQLMHGFFFQFNLPIDDIKAMAIITQTTVPPPAPRQSSVILDIDLYRTEDLQSGETLGELFQSMRACKNRVFEACLTDKARELIL